MIKWYCGYVFEYSIIMIERYWMIIFVEFLILVFIGVYIIRIKFLYIGGR